jgi:hypothetical protein
VQFSLFGAEAAEPDLADLGGLILAGGDWVSAERATKARLSILVADDWRRVALADELALRGLDSDSVAVPGGLTAVRTEFSSALAADAARWRPGASLRVPEGLALSVSGLRLWAIAAGHRDDAGYLLATHGDGSVLHRAAGAQLSRLSVAAVDVGSRGGPGWRVTSVKRLRRLAELLGVPPPGSGPDWPAG